MEISGGLIGAGEEEGLCLGKFLEGVSGPSHRVIPSKKAGKKPFGYMDSTHSQTSNLPGLEYTTRF